MKEITMEFKHYIQDNNKIAKVVSDKIVLLNEQDALDLIANSDCADTILIDKKNIIPDFFDLKTKICGNIIQKFVNYNCKLVISGNFENVNSKSLHDFIFECNKGTQINFINKILE
jgi:hypothetical protein